MRRRRRKKRRRRRRRKRKKNKKKKRRSMKFLFILPSWHNLGYEIINYNIKLFNSISFHTLVR
jgi:hypothetical protein